MAKRKPDPSDCVRDTFRLRNAGVVDVPMNSKSSTDNFHLDRSTLGEHEEYDPNKQEKGSPFKGGYVKVQNHVKQQARATMGDIRRTPASREGTADTKCENRGFRSLPGQKGYKGY